MKKQQELEMFWALGCRIVSVPQDYRSRYHTQYMNEVVCRIYELVEDLGLDQSDWDLFNQKKKK
jgi:hypothetical protein